MQTLSLLKPLKQRLIMISVLLRSLLNEIKNDKHRPKQTARVESGKGF
jgi:hypothetical protein